jgi:hypothetical protein
MEFSGYHLKRNPFVWERNLYLEYDQEVELEKFFYQKVVNYLWDTVVERWQNGNLNPIWVWHDDISLEHRIGIFGGLFRTMIISDNPKVFPVDIPVNFPKGNFLRDVYKLFLSRLDEEKLKVVFYTFLKDSLEKDEVYVNPDRKKSLLKGVREEGFSYFEKVTLGEEKDDEISKELLELTKAYFKKIEAGPALERATEIFVRLGPQHVLKSLIPVDPVEDITGLINFLRIYYDLVVIFLDNMEDLEIRKMPNKANIVGGLSELETLAENKALLIFFCQPLVKETLGKKMASKFDQLNYSFELSSYQKEALSEEEVKNLIRDFLSSDKNWLSKRKNYSDTWPFAEDALRVIFQKSRGDPIKVLEMAAKLLNEGKKSKYPVIESKLAEKVLS